MENKSIENFLREIGLNDPTPQTIEYMQVVCRNVVLFDMKQKDYGPGNIAKRGLPGVLTRICDKVERLINLEGKEARCEAIEDSYADLANYGIIGQLWLSGRWLK